MRISQTERAAILFAVHEKDPSAEVYLFGSRARDELKGGDIDLFVVSSAISFSDKIDILVQIKSVIGEQKIDLKIMTPLQAASDPFATVVLPCAVKLL